VDGGIAQFDSYVLPILDTI